MQVNKIQSSQNFGMALKINPNARVALEKQPMQILEKIKKAGDELASHKYVDVILEENCRPVVKTRYANAYSDYFKAFEPRYELLNVETRWAGTEIPGIKKGDKYLATYNMGTKEAAKEAFEKINSSYNDMDRATEFAKAIEKSSEIKETKLLKEKIQTEEVKDFTNGLLAKFGM